MGDGVLIYFGYPQAHEDDAERTIRCGLAVVDHVRQLNLAEALHARIGSPRGWLSSAARLSSTMLSAIRPISPLAYRPWPSPTLS
jgi:class 3 adenylate cyclase